MAEPLVSVIVPTYNRPRFLERALKSISEQSCQDFEVIVVNDGGENMEKIVSQFPRTRYLAHERNRGLPAARNTAIRAARGRYIAYLDDDDIWYPEHLTVCRGRIGRVNRRVVYTDCFYWYDERVLKAVMSFEFDRGTLHRHNLTPIICVMHDRSLIGECGGFDEGLPNHEDYDLLLRFSEVTDFHHISAVTCAYSKRSDGQQMSANAQAMVNGRNYVRDRFLARRKVR